MSWFLDAVTQRRFLREDQIREFVAAQVNKVGRPGSQPAPASGAATRDLRAMKFLVLEQYQTWLVCDDVMAHVVHDDRGWEKPTIKLSANIASMLPVRSAKSTRNDGIGTLSFGEMRGAWTYSEELFLDEPATERIGRFLRAQEHPQAA